MRNVCSLFAMSAWLLTSGCLHHETTPPPTQATPPAAEPTAQAPQEGEPTPEAPPGAAQPGTEPSPNAESSAEPPTGGKPGMQTPPPMGPEAPQPEATGQVANTHDLVMGTLTCVMSRTISEAMGMQAGDVTAIEEVRCAPVAHAANVPPAALRMADEAAVRAVREMIEQRATQERLDDVMKMYLLALHDKTVAASHEADIAESVADRYATAGAEKTERTMTHGGPAGTQEHAGAGHETGAMASGMTMDPADAQKLAAHEKLTELVRFSRASDAGPIASEAEAAAWLLAAHRFNRVRELPPRMKIFAAAPLFDGLLGVAMPAPAGADPNKVPLGTWSKYLDAAAKAARSASPAGMNDESGSLAAEQKAKGPPGAQPAPAAGGHAAAGPGKGSPMAAKDRANMHDILTAVAERMEMLSRRLPSSDLRTALDGYVQRLRAEMPGIGGGPSTPPAEEGRPKSNPPPPARGGSPRR